MEKYHIALNEAEQALVAQIDLRREIPTHDERRAAYLSNQQPILELLRSLSERNAIPAERLNYWNDPSYNPGRIKSSKKGLFERNGNVGSEIYCHPHFVEYLRYFLFGANLPDDVIARFEQEVGEPDYFTSGDLEGVRKCTRHLVRQYQLDPHDAAEEFYKLCLDMGLGQMAADSVRRAAKDVKVRIR